MNIRQLEIFTEVARQLSFSRAAEILHMAQPAVSIAVRKLESELDLQLLRRVDRRVLLTREGEVLLGHAENLLQQFQIARQEMIELRGLQSGTVRFSTTAMLGSYFFPSLIGQFRKKYPAIDVQIINEGTAGALQLLAAGNIDMGVINRDDLTSQLEYMPLLRDELVMCVASNHPLAKRRKINREDFCRQPLILYRQNYFLRKLVGEMQKEMGIEANIVVETDVLGIIMQLVRAGEGVSLSLKMAADAEPGVVGVPFADPQFLDLGMGWTKEGYLSLANRAFLEFLVERHS